MPVAEGDVLKAVWRVRHTSPNTVIENVFYWQVTALVDGDFNLNAADLQTQLISLYTNVQGLFSDRYVLEDMRITDETQKLFLADGTGAGFQGTDAASQVLPSQDAALVLARPRNLKVQGRKYVGPLTEAAVADGELSVGSLPQMQAFADAWDSPFAGALTTNTFTPGVARFAAGGAVAGFTAFDPTLSKVQLELRTQRRRRPTVGLS